MLCFSSCSKFTSNIFPPVLLASWGPQNSWTGQTSPPRIQGPWSYETSSPFQPYCSLFPSTFWPQIYFPPSYLQIFAWALNAAGIPFLPVFFFFFSNTSYLPGHVSLFADHLPVCRVCQLAKLARTKDYRLGALNSRNAFACCSGG